MNTKNATQFYGGVMLNAYPDSIGSRLSDTISMLNMPELQGCFAHFYILPTFFNSDLDRGFSIIDYDLNKELVSEDDLASLKKLNIKLKFDIVLNHLSVASPQFKDLLENGDASKYKDFFIDWNTFWKGNGTMGADGIIMPDQPFLDKLFMRKSGLPILKVPFPDGSIRPYWNTFYQKVTQHNLEIGDLEHLDLTAHEKEQICGLVNQVIASEGDINAIDFQKFTPFKSNICAAIAKKQTFLGQMDVNAKSPLVWQFYEDVLAQLAAYGCQVLRLDAFAYLHKEVGQVNFFNSPGTWDYLERVNQIAAKNGLMLLPEIHAEHGGGLHKEVAEKGYVIYDFFLPGLLIHTIEKASNEALFKWATEIIKNGYKTVNMLGCHDGIPVLDLKGKQHNATYAEGLLTDPEIEFVIKTILDRGGKVKNLFGADGKKIGYYQVNATYFSALGESEEKMLLARALQLFMPGIPQIWYLDIFAGANDHQAVENAGKDGHKEINRTTLSMDDVANGLKKDIVRNQLTLIKFRNTSEAFLGKVVFSNQNEHDIDIAWTNGLHSAHLIADLRTLKFSVYYTDLTGAHRLVFN